MTTNPTPNAVEAAATGAQPVQPVTQLTDEQLDQIVFDCGPSRTPRDIARAIEAAITSKDAKP